MIKALLVQRSRGGVNSWFVGGTYATVVADSHGVEVHSSYSRQRSAAASGVGVFGLEDDARSAGGVQVVDHWTIGPRAMLDVGGRYERYDYLRDPGLFVLPCGNVSRVLVREGYFKVIQKPGHFETRHVQVWVPGGYV